MFKPITQKMVAKDLLINPTQPVPSGDNFPSQCFASNDFKTIIASKPYGLVYICDGVSGAINASFTPDSTFNDFPISANGRFIAEPNSLFVSGGKYVGRVRVFDAVGAVVRTYNNPRTGYDDFFGIQASFSRDGSVIAISAPTYLNQPTNANIYGRVFIYNNTTGALITTILDPTGSQASNETQFGSEISLSGDGTKIAIGSYRYNVGATTRVGRIYIYNATNGSLLRTIESPLVQQNAYFGRLFKMNDDGSRLLATNSMPISPNTTGSYRGYLFNVDTGSLLTTFIDPRPTISTGGRYGCYISQDASTYLFYRPLEDLSYPKMEMYIYRNENSTIVKTIQTARQQDNYDWNAILNQDGTMISYPDSDYLYSGPTGGLVVKTID